MTKWMRNRVESLREVMFFCREVRLSAYGPGLKGPVFVGRYKVTRHGPCPILFSLPPCFLCVVCVFLVCGFLWWSCNIWPSLPRPCPVRAPKLCSGAQRFWGSQAETFITCKERSWSFHVERLWPFHMERFRPWYHTVSRSCPVGLMEDVLFKSNRIFPLASWSQASLSTSV